MLVYSKDRSDKAMTTREMVISPLKLATVLGAALLLWGVLLALTSSPAHAVPAYSGGSCSTADGTTTCAFGPTGSEDAFVVPAGVSSVHVVATGAPGGTAFGPASGGRGAQVSGDLTVTPDDTLYVNVGGAPTSGGCAEVSGDPAECVGGFNGGGTSIFGGGGGGASDVRTVASGQDKSLSSRLIVAGGGGGGGASLTCFAGGDGFQISGGAGGDAGLPGGTTPCGSTLGGTGGAAGGQNAGGSGGSGTQGAGQSGSLGLGGNGGNNFGGAGGGGYYGGGGGGAYNDGIDDDGPAGGGGGGSNLVPAGGTAAIATGGPSITISYVTPKNQAPVAVDDSATTNEDTATDIDVLSNDTDADKDALSISGFTQPSHGTVSEKADGTLTYAPEKDFNGSDSFTYKANDGTADSNTATIKITVRAVNDDPVANPDAIDVAEDTPTVLDVLANDTDVDGDSLEVSGVIISSLKGGWHLKGGQLTYTPPQNFTGTEELDYEVTDNHGGFDTASVKINVTPVNDAPTAKDGSYTTNEDTPANMALGATDAEGDALTYSIVGGPAHGKLTGSGDNRTYTPDPDYNGPDSFTFKASDGTADSNVATVNISVKAVNDAPTVTVVAGRASQSACLSDTSGRLTLKLSDVDSNLSDLKPSVAGSSDTKLVPNANVTFGGTGGTRTAAISTVPGRTGTSTVTLKVSDGQASSSVPVTVRAGGNGRDTLSGTSGADLLLGQNGDDTLSSLGASDVLCGANGDDKLSGGMGSDTFDGGPGTDTAPDYIAAEGDSRTNIP
jgi:hypothetical protein